MTTSGRSWLDLAGRLRAVGEDVEELDRAWALSSPRMYWATCGTSSTTQEPDLVIAGHRAGR